jgi:hypothetical protein
VNLLVSGLGFSTLLHDIERLMKKLGELLTERGKLSERDVERTLLVQVEMGDLFGQVPVLMIFLLTEAV